MTLFNFLTEKMFIFDMLIIAVALCVRFPAVDCSGCVL